MGKCCEAELIAYCNHAQGVALDFQVGFYEYFRSYYQVKGSKRIGACALSGGYSVWGNSSIQSTIILNSQSNDPRVGSSRARGIQEGDMLLMQWPKSLRHSSREVVALRICWFRFSSLLYFLPFFSSA